MTSKITSAAKARCVAHTLAEQLQQVRDSEQMAEFRRRNGGNDQTDIATAFDADAAWGGHHTRLVMPIGGAD